jgi:CheY-like chemotaxis protein
VVVADPKPLSLLATAGVLHHEGMRCICARNTDAVLKAFELEYSEGSSGLSSLPIRVDESHPHPSPLSSSAQPSLIDLIVWDVAEDPMSVLTTLQQIRQFSAFQHLPAVLLADAKWAGLEKKTEAEIAPTHCLFKPIDPKSLITIVQPLLWMPSLQSTHRQRGSRPNRPGWVTL